MTKTKPQITEKRMQLLGLLIGFFVLVAFATLPIVPVTTRREYQVIAPVEGSPIQTRLYNENIPLSTTTFQIQSLEIAFDQQVDISWHGTDHVDLIAFLSNSTTNSFIQSVMMDVGVPLGPSLSTGRNVSTLIVGLLEEKLPEIMRKTAESGYYRIEEVEDSTRLQLKAGEYNFVLLSMGNTGSLHVLISYESTETRTETRIQEEITRISVIDYLRKYQFGR